MPDQLAYDPTAVDIGDTLKSDDSKYAIAFAVTDVDAENERVRVYSPTMAQTVHRWVEMNEFTVHIPNEDITTDADREDWLNDSLPQGYRFTDDGRQELDYVLTDDGVTQQPVNG
ncbi:hypothetical protein [Halosimplex pelagicum]|uniref:Uncharacterized protein n=1 Tax=Halosimplex pelagicum TaxID=869886 RepID=A0A7D5TUB9_9EURY|nr:hypothetical protein [Halosimplex pelagicum]QLH82194.1 hypothetical protein HZS54_11510 [Halosimplex pelagicum]